MAVVGKGRFTFTATGGAGVYATEEYGVGTPQTATGAFLTTRSGVMPVSKLVFTLDSLGAATGLQVEVWVALPTAQDLSNAGNWVLYSAVAAQLGTAINTPVEINLASYEGVKLRCKAGAGAGSPTGVFSAEGPPL